MVEPGIIVAPEFTQGNTTPSTQDMQNYMADAMRQVQALQAQNSLTPFNQQQIINKITNNVVNQITEASQPNGEVYLNPSVVLVNNTVPPGTISVASYVPAGAVIAILNVQVVGANNILTGSSGVGSPNLILWQNGGGVSGTFGGQARVPLSSGLKFNCAVSTGNCTITLIGYVTRLAGASYSSSGSNTFAGLTDVSLSGLADANIAIYNSGTLKWTNQALSGDITVTNAGVTTLKNTGPGATGPIGDGTHVSQVTIDAQGRVTALASVAITGAAPTGAAGGDLSGTYPNPTVAKINNVSLGSTTATAGNLLIGSGTQWVTNAMSGDATISSVGALTLASVISASTQGSATAIPVITYDAKGRLTAVTTATPTVTSVNGSAYPSGAVLGSTLYGSAANTYSNLSPNITTTKKYLSMTGTGSVGAIPAWLQPAAADLSDGTTGSGSVVLATSPTLVTPLLGTPTSGTLTNCTGLPIVAGTTGTLTETRGGTNQTTYALGDMLYGSAANTLSKANIGANQVPFMNGSQVLSSDSGLLYGGVGGSSLVTLAPSSNTATCIRGSFPASSQNILINAVDSGSIPVFQMGIVNAGATAQMRLISPSAVTAGTNTYGGLDLVCYQYQLSGNLLGNIGAATRQGTNAQVGCAAIQFMAAENQASGKIGADIPLLTCAIGASALTTRWKFTANGNALMNATGSALATTAVDGFTFIPTMAGAPTGNGTKYTGAIGMVWDSTNNKLWVNTSGTTWKGVVLA